MKSLMKLSEKKTYYYSEIRKEMLPFIPTDSKRILEIGCGEGNFSMLLKTDARELWGIEPETDFADKASQKLFRVFNQKVEDCLSDLPDGYFDVVICNDVLEHLYNPAEILKALKPKLSSIGCIVASIPNFRYIRNFNHVFFGGEMKYEQHGILDFTHIRFFTKKSIIRLFLESGYTLEQVKGINPTRSERLKILIMVFNLLGFFSFSDLKYLQFAVKAS